MKRLIRNLKVGAEASGLEVITSRLEGFIIAETNDAPEKMDDLLRRTFGIVSADHAIVLPPDPEIVAESAFTCREEGLNPSTFGVRARRHGQKQKWGSQSFAGAIGAEILSIEPTLKVNLSEPEWRVEVALFPDRTLLIDRRIVGPGGLPLGVQGEVIASISSRDDLLTSWLVMRRGCQVILSDENVQSLVDTLQPWNPFLLSQGEVFGPGKKAPNSPWGYIGQPDMKIGVEAESKVKGKNTPIASLDAMVGWSETEKSNLHEMIVSRRVAWDFLT